MTTDNSTIFKLSDVVAYSSFQFKNPIDLAMGKNEQWIIYGFNGAGKSTLVDIIREAYRLRRGQIDYDFAPAASRRVSDNIRYVTFHDQYGSNADSTCYQLRWNQGLLDDDAPTVGEMLDREFGERPEGKRLLAALHLDDLRTKKPVMLSSGEYRRFQIAFTVSHCPHLLIIDNPYIGLDEANRRQVAAFLNSIVRLLPLQLILVVSRMVADVSAFTHVVVVDSGCIRKMPVSDFDSSLYEMAALPPEEKENIFREVLQLPNHTTLTAAETSEVLSFHDITIRYGERTILKNLDWRVDYGDKWILEGENGAGKSTLLSLVCADNPQSYACDITLFGHRRGSGESIWDIKKHIGYVSPEMYRSYRRPVPVENIVASGLYDSVGLFRKFTSEDFARIDFWLRLFGIESLRKREYTQLSGGEQRLVLLARAFVKDPDLLILDEPFHGLDARNRRRAMWIIEAFCSRPHKTMVMVSHYKEDFPSCITHRLCLKKNK